MPKFFLGLFMLACSNLALAVIVVPYIEPAPIVGTEEYVHFNGAYLADLAVPATSTKLDIQIQMRYRSLVSASTQYLISDENNTFSLQGLTQFGEIQAQSATLWGGLFGFVGLAANGVSAGDTVLIRMQVDNSAVTDLPLGARLVLSFNGIDITTSTAVQAISALGNFVIGNQVSGGAPIDQDILSITIDTAVGEDPLSTLHDFRGSLAYWNALPEMNGTVTLP